MNCVLGEECTSLLTEITYLKLRLSIVESKSGDSINNYVALSMQLLNVKEKVEELNKQLQEKDEILKEAEGAIIQIENMRNASAENYLSKLEQLENKNATNEKEVKRLQGSLESAQQNNGTLTQKMCQLELENLECKNEISRLNEQLLDIRFKNMEHKSMIKRGKSIKLKRLKKNVKELRLHFKMCDDIANIKLANQCEVIDKLNCELNEMKDMQQNLIKIIFNCQSTLKSETNELTKTNHEYDTAMFWQIMLRDYKTHEVRLINTPKMFACQCEAQMSYMPQVHIMCKCAPKNTRSAIEVNIVHEQQKHNFSKILRAFGRFSAHGVQIGAFIYIKYLNIGRIDDSITTLNYLKNMSI